MIRMYFVPTKTLAEVRFFEELGRNWISKALLISKSQSPGISVISAISILESLTHSFTLLRSSICRFWFTGHLSNLHQIQLSTPLIKQIHTIGVRISVVDPFRPSNVGNSVSRPFGLHGSLQIPS